MHIIFRVSISTYYYSSDSKADYSGYWNDMKCVFKLYEASQLKKILITVDVGSSFGTCKKLPVLFIIETVW